MTSGSVERYARLDRSSSVLWGKKIFCIIGLAEELMGSDRLSTFCSGIIEAGWLMAVALVPLFFNGYSSTVMDPDKLALLRSIASIMAVAWSIKWIDQFATRRKEAPLSLASPVVLATLFISVAYLLGTAASIAPRISFFGAYHRPQGTLAMLSYLVIFAMVIQGLRTRQQLNRLIVTMILASLPIILYGVVQKYDQDPLQWDRDFGGRAGSTLGNPIFLAAYLLSVFFLTIFKFIENVRTISIDKRSTTHTINYIRTALYAVLAIAQSVAILLTGSRGPWIGGFAGIILFVLLIALIWHQRRMVLSAVGLGLAGVICLIVLNLPNTPFEPLRNSPVLERISHLTSTSGDFRLLTWENAARLFFPHKPILFPDNTPDQWNMARPFIGYGPDSLSLVYPQTALADPISRSANTTTDRSHNQTWDILVTIGLLGLGAYQLLWLSLFLLGLRSLGLVQTKRDLYVLVGLWIGLALTGGVIVIVGDAKFLGLAIPFGNCTAIVLYLIRIAVQNNHPSSIPVDNASILRVALLAIFFAGYIESQFGIAVPATEVNFWVLVGMLVVACSDRLNVPHKDVASIAQTHPQSLFQESLAWLRVNGIYVCILTAILFTLFFEFVSYVSGMSAFTLLWRGMSFNPVHNIDSYAILSLFTTVWLFASSLISTESELAELRRSRVGFVLNFALPVVASFVLAFVLAAQLSSLTFIPTPVVRIEDVLTLANQAMDVLNYYVIVIFLLMILIAAVMMLGDQVRSWYTSRWGVIGLLPLLLLGFLWINNFQLNPVRADVVFRLGQLLDQSAEWDATIALYKRAIQIAPTTDSYFMALGRAYQEKSRASIVLSLPQLNEKTPLANILELDERHTAALNRLDLLYAAQATLLQARDLNPLYVDHSVNLARFYFPDLPVDTPSKMKLVELSNQYYLEANRLSPSNVVVLNEWADFDLKYRNDPSAALKNLLKSCALDSTFDQTWLYLGKTYVAQKQFGLAIDSYRKSIEINPDNAEAHGRLGFAYSQQGQLAEAIQEYQAYTQLASSSATLWEAHKNLALLYEQSGNLKLAVQEAETALDLAPSEVKSQIVDLVTRLRTTAGLQ